jgi:acyl CoA:acetate/3-ketoacid CoA transferase
LTDSSAYARRNLAVDNLTPESCLKIAPAVDLERDVLKKMKFQPIVSLHLGEMNRVVFKQGKMNLRKAVLDSLPKKVDLRNL